MRARMRKRIPSGVFRSGDEIQSRASYVYACVMLYLVAVFLIRQILRSLVNHLQDEIPAFNYSGTHTHTHALIHAHARGYLVRRIAHECRFRTEDYKHMKSNNTATRFSQ